MDAGQQFVKLLEPGKIGTMSIRNRTVMAPMYTALGEVGGFVTRRNQEHFAARAKGGVGLAIVAFTCVDSPEGRAHPRQLTIDDDKYLPGLEELAKSIKQHGARAVIQLHHPGRTTQSGVTGLQPVAPSPIPVLGGETPRQLTEIEIARLVGCFARGAARAQKAGFDGVELHAAHGYLISQFISAFSNQRQDGYGGSLENRARFLLEIIRAIRQAVGRDYPVWCRINGAEIDIENGLTSENSQQVARMAEAVGADAIHVSASSRGGIPRPPMAQPVGTFLTLAESIKKAVTVPVIAVARINPWLGETALKEGKADFIAFGRALLADPELVNKIAANQLDDVKPCIYCGNCINEVVQPGSQGITCTVNPALGRESDFSLTTASKSKKVMVIGGGPAGMEAARVAALRGHRVTLYEKEKGLGGQLLPAQVPHYKQTIGDLNQYLSTQMRKLGVKVQLNSEVNAKIVADESPDAVVLAAGSSPFIPHIPGIGGKNVVLAIDVLNGKSRVGRKVAIIGGELVACELAEMLMDTTDEITLTTLESKLLNFNVIPSIKQPLLYRLATEKKVTVLTGVQYKAITGNGMIIHDSDGKERFIEAETVVLAAGTRPNVGLLTRLKEIIAEVYPAGDCVKPRNILEAMKEGYEAGLLL